MPGNVAKLADDCWAFGASIAQEALLKEADCVLKAPDRRIPPCSLKPSATTQTPPSCETSKLEGVISNMVRLDREMQELRASAEKMKASLAAQRARIADLEELAARPAARIESQNVSGTAPVNSVDSVLGSGPENALENGSARECAASEITSEVSSPPEPNESNGSPSQTGEIPLPPAMAPEQVESTLSNEEATKGNISPKASSDSTEDCTAPAIECVPTSSATGAVATKEHLTDRPDPGLTAQPVAGLAAEMARSLDLDRLAGAIVAHMKKRTGTISDSDSDCSDSPSDSDNVNHEVSAHLHHGRPQRSKRGRPAVFPQPSTVNVKQQNPTQPTSPRHSVPATVGTGDTAELRGAPPVPMTFILEGINPDTPDSTVHRVVSNLVCDVSQFLKLETSGVARGKSFLFTAVNCEERVVLDPANWPIGLQIRRSKDNGHRTRETSMKHELEPVKKQQQQRQRRPRWWNQQQRKGRARPSQQYQQEFSQQGQLLQQDPGMQRQQSRQVQQTYVPHQARQWDRPQQQQVQQSSQSQWREQQPHTVSQQHTSQTQWSEGARHQKWQTGQPCLHQPEYRPQQAPPPLPRPPPPPPPPRQQQLLASHHPQLRQQQQQPDEETPRIGEVQSQPSQLQYQIQQLAPPPPPPPLQRQQQQPGVELPWRGQGQSQTCLFRTDSWPSLPSRQESDRRPVATAVTAAPPIAAAAHGNMPWSSHLFNC